MFFNKLNNYLAIWIIFTASLVAQIPNIIINEFLASNAHINYDPDYKQYTDWLELYNKENYQINLNGYYLTDDLTNPTKWRITDDITIEPNSYIVFWADNEENGFHTDFKLNKDGEQISIYMPDGSIVDTVTYKFQQVDISRGRNPNDENAWLYYYNPTPGTINNTIGYPEIVNCSKPIFSEGSGFYTNDISLEITAASDAEIRYTLDGSEPNENSEKYTDPINISDRSDEPNYFSEIPTNINPPSWFPTWSPPVGDVRKATTVRARNFTAGKMPSKIVTHTYFIGSDIKKAFSTIPVISIVSDEKHMFSDSAGIYVPGISYTGKQGEGNYMSSWNRPAHIEYFDESGDLKISQEVDVRTQGSTSPTSPQKGLHIIARSKYGKSTIDYALFKNGKSKANELNSFKRFIIRAWGSVWNQGMVNDALAQTSYAKLSVDIQDYRLTIVFVNGEYWGLQEIREANKNSYYFQEHYGIDRDDPGVDILVGGANHYYIDEGDDNHWKGMMDFINKNDLSLNQNYEYIKTQMDVDNFIDYIGHTVYCGKFDWPGQNEAFWRPKTENGRWKWIQYDMDLCFSSSDYDMITHVLQGTNEIGPHSLLKKLLKNEQFKLKFVNWFMDRINSIYLPEIIHNNYNEMLNDIYPYLDEHQNRWAISKSNFGTFTAFIRNFISLRPGHMQAHLKNYFNLGDLNTITIDRKTEDGIVKINTLVINEKIAGASEDIYPWSGKYFEDVPINIVTSPNEGYIFDHWEGSIASDSDSVSCALLADASLTAVFSPIEKVNSLYINEISADNNDIIADSSGKYDDWIELYNASNDTINLAGFYLTNDFTKSTKWKIPLVDSISFNILPDEHKIIWCDNDPEEGQDHVGFSLSKMGEVIGLTQITGSDSVFIDSLSFPEQLSNISYGRFPDASDKWEFMLLPTPGSSNIFKPIFLDQLNSPQLFQNYPNPFNLNTNIPFYLSEISNIAIDIYNIKGELIKSLINGEEEIGYHEILWNGKDNNGSSVSSGVYFYSFQMDNFTQVKKMLYLK